MAILVLNRHYFWDPVGFSGMSFWMHDNDQTAGYLRHAEIKHGRVAMAAFLGYCVQCLGVVKDKHTFLPYCGYVADVPPQEQGKLQILTFVGMLESHGEIPGDVPHYTAPGGLQGYCLRSRATARRSSSTSTSRSTTSRRHNHHGRHRVSPSCEV